MICSFDQYFLLPLWRKISKCESACLFSCGSGGRSVFGIHSVFSNLDSEEYSSIRITFVSTYYCCCHHNCMFQGYGVTSSIWQYCFPNWWVHFENSFGEANEGWLFFVSAFNLKMFRPAPIILLLSAIGCHQFLWVSPRISIYFHARCGLDNRQ